MCYFYNQTLEITIYELINDFDLPLNQREMDFNAISVNTEFA